MPTYKGTVTIENRLNAATWDNVYIKLVGTDGASEREMLSTGTSYLYKDPVLPFEVNCQKSIGKLILIEVDKKPHFLLPQNDWFPAKVEVESPEGDTYIFPIYHWITNTDVQIFREGTALTGFQPETDQDDVNYTRAYELKLRQKEYSWTIYAKEIPHCLKVDDGHPLPMDVRFSVTKEAEFAENAIIGEVDLEFKGLLDCAKKWKSIKAIRKVFSHRQTTLSDHVQDNWMKDSLFGYQFLNGVNPMVIRRCSKLPKNLPVEDHMVFIHGESSLQEELQNGNIFLCDYKILDKLPGNIINGKQQYLMAPLVLLQKTPKNKLKPIAIQLKQEPSKDNPIFVPNDSEYNWLLAKMFVRSADFSVHELDSHLLRTHLLGEVFSMSLLRNLPMVHPLYKLLIPHTRYTLQINVLAREKLISKNGFFNMFAASGGEALKELLQRAGLSVTYTSLCIRDDIKERGLESVPNFYYRDDGVQIWDLINSFVQGVLGFYYKKDSDVSRDKEIQAWVQGIFENGFFSRQQSGMPERLNTVAELVKFVTMVIFTVSAQHAAVNSGQFDYGSWMPNTPTSIQQAPSTIKTSSDRSTILETLPDINVTVNAMSLLFLLSKPSSDFVPLGHYPEEQFCQSVPKEQMKLFKGRLADLSAKIKARNAGLKIPYTFLDPELIENSVTI